MLHKTTAAGVRDTVNQQHCLTYFQLLCVRLIWMIQLFACVMFSLWYPAILDLFAFMFDCQWQLGLTATHSVFHTQGG